MKLIHDIFCAQREIKNKTKHNKTGIMNHVQVSAEENTWDGDSILVNLGTVFMLPISR